MSLICVAGSGIIFRSLNAKIIKKKKHPLTLQNGAGLFVPMLRHQQRRFLVQSN